MSRNTLIYVDLLINKIHVDLLMIGEETKGTIFSSKILIR